MVEYILKLSTEKLSSNFQKWKNSKTNLNKIYNTTALQTFLNTLDVGVQASIQINGSQCHSAVVCVDFGSPLVQARLSPEETHVLNDHIRNLSKDIISNKDLAIRINHDGPNGMYWSSIV